MWVWVDILGDKKPVYGFSRSLVDLEKLLINLLAIPHSV